MLFPRKTGKYFLFEFIEWLCLAAPIFVTGAELAAILRRERDESYWLVVWVIFGYVLIVTICIWLPVKVLLQWKKVYDPHTEKWCQATMLYVLLSALPCVTMILIGIETSRSNTTEICNSNTTTLKLPEVYFQTSSVEIMCILLALTGICEKLKEFKLRLTKDTIARDAYSDKASDTNSEYVGYNTSRRQLQPRTMRRKTKFSPRMIWRDNRPLELYQNMLNIYDIRLIFGLAQDYVVCEGAWVYPIYIFGLVGMSSLIVTRNSPYSSATASCLIDVPFFILRFAAFIKFGLVTSVLFFMKNVIVICSLLYFNIFIGYFFKGSNRINQPSIPPQTTESTQNTPNGGISNGIYQSQYGNNNRRPQQLPVVQPIPDSNHYSQDEFDESGDEVDGNYPVNYDHESHDYDDGMRANSPRHSRPALSEDTFNQPEVSYHQQDPVEYYNQPLQVEEQQQHTQEDLYSVVNEGSRVKDQPSLSSTPPVDTISNVSSEVPVNDHQQNHNNQPEENYNQELIDPPPPANDDLPPPPPSNAFDESQTADYTVGKHRVSLPKGKQYTPDLAAAIAKEAFETRANAAVNEIENVLSEDDEDNYDSGSEGQSGLYDFGQAESIASSYSVQL